MIKITHGDLTASFATPQEAADYTLDFERRRFRYSIEIDGHLIYCWTTTALFGLIEALNAKELDKIVAQIELPGGMKIGVRDENNLEEITVALHRAISNEAERLTLYRIVRKDGTPTEGVSVLFQSEDDARRSAERSYADESESRTNGAGVWSWLDVEPFVVVPLQESAAAE